MLLAAEGRIYKVHGINGLPSPWLELTWNLVFTDYLPLPRPKIYSQPSLQRASRRWKLCYESSNLHPVGVNNWCSRQEAMQADLRVLFAFYAAVAFLLPRKSSALYSSVILRRLQETHPCPTHLPLC